MREINLISQRRDILLHSKKIIRIARIIATVVLFSTLLVAFIVFFLKFSSPLSSLKKEEENLSLNFSNSKQQAAKLAVVKNRLANISDLLSKRSDFDIVMTLLINEAPPDLQISTVDLDSKNISLTATSPSLNSIIAFVNKLVEMSQNKKNLGKITLDNLVADPILGKYTISISSELL